MRRADSRRPGFTRRQAMAVLGGGVGTALVSTLRGGTATVCPGDHMVPYVESLRKKLGLGAP